MLLSKKNKPLLLMEMRNLLFSSLQRLCVAGFYGDFGHQINAKAQEAP
jgi:hypothetical protein